MAILARRDRSCEATFLLHDERKEILSAKDLTRDEKAERARRFGAAVNSTPYEARKGEQRT